MRKQRLRGLAASLADPRSYSHLARMVHYWNYTHVAERRKLTCGPGVRIAPTVSFTNGERISIGPRSHIGAGCSLWAGNTTGRITLGADALLGPEVFITASNYSIAPGIAVMSQPTLESDVVIGADVWLGARVMVVAGVTIGDGCVVGAGSIVTKDLPAGAIAVGNPARVVRWRDPAAAPVPLGGEQPLAAEPGAAEPGADGPWTSEPVIAEVRPADPDALRDSA